jgi:uncharacterized protein (UPF0332 family)
MIGQLLTIEEALVEGILVKKKADKAQIVAEQELSRGTLRKAKTLFQEEDYKRSIKWAFDAIFHAAKVKMLSEGYEEKEPHGVRIFLKEKTPSDVYELYDAARLAEIDAVDRFSFTVDGTREQLERAEAFLEKI